MALPAVMRALAPEMERIGWDRPLGPADPERHAPADRPDRRSVPRRDGRDRRRGGDPLLMLDFNPRPSMAERINALVDAALIAEREATPPRTYLGASRLGHACERALQFEFAGAPKDEGADFGGQTLRIFEIGHHLEDLAIRWLRAAGLDLYTRKGNQARWGSVRILRRGRSHPWPCRRDHRRQHRPPSVSAPRRSGNARP